jgi:TonB-linked SusC/RagA family outer membrane protein
MKKNKPDYYKILLLWIVFLGLLAVASPVNAQNISVSGLVTDESGQPVPGVYVILKGSHSGSITDSTGRYTLENLPADAVLVFSSVGYIAQEVPVNGRMIIDILLREDIIALSEIVINAGYYSVKERERTGSIVKITAKEIENQPVNNVLAAMQGRMAGVNITQGSGVPGGGYTVQIRGANSLRSEGNYPLYIIDGVPVNAETPSNSISAGIFPNTEINPLNAVNPNDIESIEILKDADATAIYGSRGANGVILISTKKGKTGQTSFSINTNYGFSRMSNKMELMNTQQYLEMRRQAYANDGITEYPANAYDINGTWDETRYTDWQDKLIGGTAVNSTVQFSVSGGSENTNFLISGSHTGQTTVFAKNYRYKTNNLSGSLTHNSSDNRFELDASGLFSVQNNDLIRNDVTKQTLQLSPNAPALYNDDGSLNWESSTWTNPVADYERTYSNDSKTLNLNLRLSYKLFKAISMKLNGGINHQIFEELALSPSTRYNPAFGITSASSSASKGYNNRFSYLLEPQISYSISLKEHKIDVLIGGTYQQDISNSLSINSYNFESNALITNMAAASTIMIRDNMISEYRYAAVFGRINYQYKNRYILNLTGRRDGSSRFGPDNRFANFGAIGAAWLFSEESFLADFSWFNFGKLRASYGITGSDLIGDYQYLDTYAVSSTVYGDGTTLYPSGLYNPDFSWEKTTKLEIALELGFFFDRIHLATAWYRNRSGNQLVGIPLPGTTGFSSIQANLPATVENTGLELELNAILLKTAILQWSSNLNICFPRNKLVAFPGLEGSTYANQYVVGYPVTIVKVYNYEGIDPETGLYTFTDYNEDGSISSPEDNHMIEEVGVKYFGGWSNQVTYKKWGLSFLFQFVNQIQKNYNSLLTRPGSMYNQPVEVLNVWSESNPNGTYMPYSSGADSQKNRLHGYFTNSTATIDDASFIRLKSIKLSYRLIVNKYVQDIYLYVQGQNLLTLTDYFGMDPEFITTGYLPPLKTSSFGVQINF